MPKGIELLQEIVRKNGLTLSLRFESDTREPFVIRVESPGYGNMQSWGQTLEGTVNVLDAFISAMTQTEPLRDREELPRSVEVTAADRYLVTWILHPFVEIDELPEEAQHWIRTGEGKQTEKYDHMARRVAAHRQDGIRQLKQG